MAPLTTTRTLLELRVGSTHTIEILLQIRLADVSWWNSDLHDHECQLYKLIGRRVLPVECREEMDADRARAREAADYAERKKMERGGGGGGEGTIGEANSTMKVAAENQKSAAGRRKRGGTTRGAKSSKKKKEGTDEKNSKDGGGNNALASESKEKKLRLLREAGTWVMGTSIQICYMMEEIDSSSAATLIFRPNENYDAYSEEHDGTAARKQSRSSKERENMVPLATFRTWKKLPKRLNVWVFKLDPNDPTDLSSSEGGAFPRPELLPVADIFRSVGGDD